MLQTAKGSDCSAVRGNAAMNAEHAQTFNPAGISYHDAIRSLRQAGYNESDISGLTEIVGDDRWGQHIWRFRTDHHPGWEDEKVAPWGPYPAEPTS
jgi:hypothetical protein